MITEVWCWASSYDASMYYLNLLSSKTKNIISGVAGTRLWLANLEVLATHKDLGQLS